MNEKEIMMLSPAELKIRLNMALKRSFISKRNRTAPCGTPVFSRCILEEMPSTTIWIEPPITNEQSCKPYLN